MARLEALNLAKSYRGRRVIRDVSISMDSGEIVGLLGPNGAGKTTCFYMILGIVPADSGRILLGGEDITRLPMYGRARKGIGYLPQEASVFRRLTVAQNILAILQTRKTLSRQRMQEKLEELLQELGHRGADHRPQCARDPGHLRARLHRGRGPHHHRGRRRDDPGQRQGQGDLSGPAVPHVDA